MGIAHVGEPCVECSFNIIKIFLDIRAASFAFLFTYPCLERNDSAHLFSEQRRIVTKDDPFCHRDEHRTVDRTSSSTKVYDVIQHFLITGLLLQQDPKGTRIAKETEVIAHNGYVRCPQRRGFYKSIGKDHFIRIRTNWLYRNFSAS